MNYFAHFSIWKAKNVELELGCSPESRKSSLQVNKKPLYVLHALLLCTSVRLFCEQQPNLGRFTFYALHGGGGVMCIPVQGNVKQPKDSDGLFSDTRGRSGMPAGETCMWLQHEIVMYSNTRIRVCTYCGVVHCTRSHTNQEVPSWQLCCTDDGSQPFESARSIMQSFQL